MRTFRTSGPQLQHNGVIVPSPFEVRTPNPYGGYIVTKHLSMDEAASRVRQLQRAGEDGEIVRTEQLADQAA